MWIFCNHWCVSWFFVAFHLIFCSLSFQWLKRLIHLTWFTLVVSSRDGHFLSLRSQSPEIDYYCQIYKWKENPTTPPTPSRSRTLVVGSTLLNLDEITLIEVIGPIKYKFAISLFVSLFYLELAGPKMAQWWRHLKFVAIYTLFVAFHLNTFNNKHVSYESPLGTWIFFNWINQISNLIHQIINCLIKLGFWLNKLTNLIKKKNFY